MPRAKSPQDATKQITLPGAFELFKPNWSALKVNPRAIILYAIIPSVLGALITLIGNRVSPIPAEPAQISDLVNALATPYYMAAYGLLLIVTILIAPATTIVLLKSARGERVGLITSFTQSFKYLVRMTGLTLLYLVALIIGLGLLLAPGLILLAQSSQPSAGHVLVLMLSILVFLGISLFVVQRLLLSQYYLVDRNMSIKQSVKTSWAEARLQSVAVWGLLGVILIVNMVGGLFSSVPYIGVVLSLACSLTYIVAPAIRYMQIKEVTK